MYYEPENLRMIRKKSEKELTVTGLAQIKTDPLHGEDMEPERTIKELILHTIEIY